MVSKIEPSGTFTISIGSSAARWMPPGVSDLSDLDHTITVIDSTGKTQEKENIKAGSSPAYFTVAVGLCEITVEAYLNGVVVA